MIEVATGRAWRALVDNAVFTHGDVEVDPQNASARGSQRTLAPYESRDGIQLGSRAWLVTAGRRP